ncbi:hypothetical protein GP5015_2068 [gamma proteobacterium HTCC5015]|nr:hypothetical protein GP5015_2068 [gamma proteobacterium HTCC5015]
MAFYASKYTLSACFLLLSLSGCQPEACGPCETQVEQFFGQLAQGTTQTAFDQLFENATVANQQVTVNQFQNQTNALLRSNKQVLGYEKVDEKSKGRLYTTVYYLYQEESVTRWAFYFYQRPSGVYRLTNLDATQSTTHFDLY